MPSDFRVHSVQHASSLPDANAARDLLERVRRSAEALLRARSWRVLSLVELCCCKEAPEKSAASVAGWCRPVGDSATAERIALRLRHPKGKGHGLLPFEEVFGTMIHELTHIVHMKHSAAFYQLMDELQTQWEQLEASGKVLDEAGFPTVGGQRVTDSAHNPRTASDGRAKALEAAEARARRFQNWGSGTLGHGRTPGADWARLSPRERAARAAERRAAEAARGLGDDELPDNHRSGFGASVLGTKTPEPRSDAELGKRKICSRFRCNCGLVHTNAESEPSAAKQTPSSAEGRRSDVEAEEERLLQLAMAASLDGGSGAKRSAPHSEEEAVLQAVLAASAAESRACPAGATIVLSDDETEMAIS
eukprot:TRINITY_DN26374_c0_g1_i1.p1 TRINITY_DN26374_c0_g1~~TRINITY_DN26374_c0_g1_i1.p1  ORF type:complete len:364 (+),score=79.03 TRINITY_DN26374_c0_g1_i1:57-1148(+)